MQTDNVHHDALISKKLFAQVQNVLDGNGFHKQEKHEYAFSETMICGECESTISSQVQKGHKYYNCSKSNQRRTGKKCSHTKCYREEWIEENMAELLAAITIPKEFIEWSLKILRKNHEQEVNTYEASRIAEQNALNAAKKRKANLLALKISPQNEGGELLSDAEFLKEKTAIDKEIQSIEAKINDNASHEENWLQRCEEFFDFSLVLREKFIEGSTEEKRTILSALGKIRLNQNKMAFQLEKPYCFLKKIVEMYTEEMASFEPEKSKSGSDKTSSFAFDCSKWWTIQVTA